MDSKPRVAVVALVVVASLASCSATDTARSLCVQRDTVFTLEGPQQRYPGAETIPAGAGIDATAASWTIADPYPVTFEKAVDGEQSDICFAGGRIVSLNGQGTTWAVWHDTAAMVVKRPDFTLIGTDFDNVGDGVRFATLGAQRWEVRGVHMRGIRDDCIENDHMQAGTIDDSFFDGCFVFYSARGPHGSLLDGSANEVTISNSLVRLEPMAFPDLDDGYPGHGPIFKMSANPEYGRSPQLAIHNTVFRLDQEPARGAQLAIPRFDHDLDPETAAVPYLDPADCSHNTIVWLGEGPFPESFVGAFPSCFTVTTDRDVWNDAVAAWVMRHTS